MQIRVVFKIVVYVSLFFISGSNAFSQKVLQIGEFEAQPGEKKSGFINVAIGTKGPEVQVPVIIVNGAKDGPILTIAAGVEEYDNPPFYALQQFKNELDPSQLSGAVIIVYSVTTPSFLRRTIYHNPYEGFNLKRVYPGKSTGTIGERITYRIREEVVDRSDFLIDMHCSEANENLISYIYCPTRGNPFLTYKTKDLALHFGFDVIVSTRYRPKDATATVSLGNEAYRAGKPSLTVICGEHGNPDEEEIDALLQGFYNTLKFLKMIEGKPEAKFDHIWVKQITTIKSEYEGVFYPAVKKGQEVKLGDTLGVIQNTQNMPVQEISAPYDGIIHYIKDNAPVENSDPLISIGEL